MSDATNNVVQVECSTVEQVRRAVFCELKHLPDIQRRLANSITRRLRDERLLRSSVEECYEAGQLGRLWGRSREWVVRTFFAAGQMPFGQIARDGGGWLIPASVAEAYLAAHIGKVAAEKGAPHGLDGEGKRFQKRPNLADRAGLAAGRLESA